MKPMADTKKVQVMRLVKKMIDNRVEDKHVLWTLDNLTDHNSGIGVAGDVVPLVQQIAQGTGEQNRLGDRIRPKYLKVSGIVTLDKLSGFQYSQNIRGRIIAFKQNDVKVGSANASVDIAHLLRSPDAPYSQYFTGAARDLCLPVNTDKFKVLYDKQFKLVPCNYAGVGLTAGQIAPPNPYMTFKYSFKVKLPSSLKYDTANGDWPNNFAPFMVIGYSYPDGTAPDVMATMITNTAVSHLIFEDA